MDVDTPTPPPAPAPVNPGQAAGDYVRAMADPALQGLIYQNEATYRPQYTVLNLADMETYLKGTSTQAGALDMFGYASNAAQGFQSAANRSQREADIRDVTELGSQAAAAFRAANPELTQQLQRASGLQSYSDPFAALSGAINSTTKQADIGRGELGDVLYDRAKGPALGAVGTQLQGRASELAKSTGALNADEQRMLEQQVRAAYTAQGRGMDSAAVSGEALARLTNQRQRMQEDLAMANSLNNANVNETATNNSFATNIYGMDLNRQAGNRAYSTAFDQQRIQNLGQLGQLQAGQLGADRAYAMQLAQAQAAIASDPFQAILGRSSGALQYGAGQQGFAGNATQTMQGPQLFNPDAGINLGLQNAANQGNYQAAVYGAQANSVGQQRAGFNSMIGNIGSSLIGGLF